MITGLTINNFRSIEKQVIPLAPLTFLYGNNATGKSSLFYAFNILRNIITNPNQSVDAFFNLGFANLGTFKQVVFNHEDKRSIVIAVSGRSNNTNFTYGVELRTKEGEFFLKTDEPYSLILNLPITFPYPLNGNVQAAITIGEISYNINWTGVSAQVTPTTVTDESKKEAQNIADLINRGSQLIMTVDVIALKRGFSKPQYGVVNLTQFPASEEEVASMLAVDEYLDTKVSTYLEQTIDRQFRIRTQPGTSLVSLTTIEKKSKTPTDIVNDGFGVNQLVYLLAKTLNKNVNTLCIEEPEINLHPGVVRRLPHTLIELIEREERQLVISTHSEALVLALLSSIARGEIKTSKILFYLTTRSSGVTNFKKQEITDDGQVEDGLKSFMVGELEDIDAFFKAIKKSSQKKKSSPDTKATDIDNESTPPLK